MKLSILILTISLSSFAQYLNNPEFRRLNIEIPNYNPRTINDLVYEINIYKKLFKTIDNVQFKDGTVIEVKDLKLPTSFRETFGTGGGG